MKTPLFIYFLSFLYLRLPSNRQLIMKKENLNYVLPVLVVHREDVALQKSGLKLGYDIDSLFQMHTGTEPDLLKLK
jgi:hypothetical protein